MKSSASKVIVVAVAIWTPSAISPFLKVPRIAGWLRAIVMRSIRAPKHLISFLPMAPVIKNAVIKKKVRVISGQHIREHHTRALWRSVKNRVDFVFAGDAIRRFGVEVRGKTRLYSVGMFFSGRCLPVYFALGVVDSDGQMQGSGSNPLIRFLDKLVVAQLLVGCVTPVLRAHSFVHVFGERFG